jgi:hypothetical protein
MKRALFQILLCQNSSLPIGRFEKNQLGNKTEKKGKLIFSFQNVLKKQCTKTTLFVSY